MVSYPNATNGSSHSIEWERRSIQQSPLCSGFYFCFSSNNSIVMENIASTDTLFTTSCRQLVPAHSSDDTIEVIIAVQHVVDMFCHLDGGRFSELIIVGLIVPQQVRYVLVGPFEEEALDLLDNASIRSHPWMSVVSVL
jgi:hypothetical protein